MAMGRSEKLRRLREMLRQIAPEGNVEELHSTFESTRAGTPDDEFAAAALERVAHDEAIDEEEEHALEAIVLPRYRPVVDIINDTFATPPSPWQHLGAGETRKHIQALLPAIGRVESPQHPRGLPYVGTGFVVGPELIMTNRHVAEEFATGLGRQSLAFRPGQSALLDFKQEIVPSSPISAKVEEIVMIHPYWDMALLRVPELPSELKPLPLSVVHPDELKEHEEVVRGYPAQDWRNDLQLQQRIFRGVFNVKRLQPGRLSARRMQKTFCGYEVNALTHDSSTLGGNSGSTVVDLATGDVVALHFGGIYLDANFAVPTHELARDRYVVDCQINFQGTAEPTDEWLAFWRRAEGNGLMGSPGRAVT